MGKVLLKCYVKAIRSKHIHAGFSFKWMFAKRGILILGDDALSCDDWRIDYSEIKDATLLSIPYLFTKAYVLTVRTEDDTYQFGTNPNAFWRGPLPFPIVREEAGGYWVLANVVRIVLIAGFFLWAIGAIINAL